MGRTLLTSEAYGSESVLRSDLNVSTAGSAVVRKIIAGAGVSLSSTGADAGTGDVTVNATGSSGITSRGDANYTILTTDRYVNLTTAFTADRTFTFPSASSFGAGQTVIISDMAAALSATGGLVVALNGTDNAVAQDNTTFTTTILRGTNWAYHFTSDGVSKWFVRGYALFGTAAYNAVQLDSTGRVPVGVSRRWMQGSASNSNISQGQTAYFGQGGSTTTVGSENLFTIVCPVTGTLKNFSVKTHASPTTNNWVFTLRKELADTTLVATVDPTHTLATDSTHTVSVTQGDRLSVKLVSGASTGTCTNPMWFVEVDD